uniref:Small ribosomal subunit protein uS2c n=1 Tax=Karlodinium veneficum TaxID=407301 RepID=G1E781_KARVE|nr:ribosomal protein S2 [Karlodinium veneficum]
MSFANFIKSYGHLGIHRRNWKPAIFSYIFKKEITYLKFDLIQTQTALIKVSFKIQKFADANKNFKILIIGTSLESKKVIRYYFSFSNRFFYVTHKWKGGIVSNWQETKKRINRLIKEIILSKLRSKAYLKALRRCEELKEQIVGLKSLKYIPKMVIFTDPTYDNYALKECHHRGLKVVALVDTDCDLEIINYPIPINTRCSGAIQEALQILLDIHPFYFRNRDLSHWAYWALRAKNKNGEFI